MASIVKEEITARGVELYVDIESVFDDLHLKDLIKDSWVGDTIKQISQLSNVLRDNQNKRELDITSLITD